MLKLRFSKPSFKKYMDGKITVCKYECLLTDNQTKQIIAEFKVTGSAKCSPNDEVDNNFGAKLADSRAKLMAYKKAISLYPDSVIDALIEKANTYLDILEFTDTMQYLKKKEIDHIKNICSEV